MGLLDPLLRKVLHIAGVALPERGKWDIVSGATAVDNPITKTTEITIGGGATDTSHAALAQVANELDTSNATPATIGATFALPADSVTTVDAQVSCILAGAAKAKVFNVRRHFLNDGGTVTASTQADVSGPDEIGGSLASSVAIAYTGTTGRTEVTGIAATDLRWRLDRQTVRVTAAAVVGSVPAAPSAITPSSGSTGGGTSVSITVPTSVGLTGAKVGGVALTSFAIADGTHVTGTTGAHSAGAVDVVTTNAIGDSPALAAAFTYSAASGLATMPLTLYLEDDYAGSPWTSTASAGTSGGRTVTEATNPPTAGTDLNATGKNAALFNGTTSKLALAGGLVLSDLVTAATGGVLIVYKADAGQAAQAGNATIDVDLISDSGGYLAIGVSASKVSAYVYDVADKQIDLAATHDGATWNKVFMRWDAGLLEASINGGALSTLAAGSLGAVSGTVNIGKAYGAHFFPGEIKVVATWASKPSNGDLTVALAGILAEYGI